MRNPRSALAGLGAVLLLMTACAETSDSASDGSEQAGGSTGGGGGGDASADMQFSQPDSSDVCSAENPGVGGTFNLQAYVENGGFDPASTRYTTEAGMQVYGTLMRWDGVAGDFEPWYAESLTSNEVADEWTLTLKDASYSDGTPLTGEAVVKNIERFLDPELPNSFAYMVRLIDEMEVTDERTVVFQLSEPWGTFPWLLTNAPGHIVNPNVLDSMTSEELSASPPPEAGLGAFTFESWNPGQRMVLTAKDDWWGGDLCVDQVNVTWNAAGQASYEAMAAGQIDHFVTWDNQGLVGALEDDNVQVWQLPMVASPFVMNNQTLTDVRIRQAIAHQADGDLVNERIWGGLGSGSHALMPPSSDIQPEVEPLHYDPDKSKELVEAAKADGWDGQLEYTINAVPGNVNQGVLQQATAKNVGIDIVRDELQIQEYIPKVNVQRNFEATMGAIIVDPGCLWCGFALYESTNPNGWMGADYPELDEAIAGLRAAATPDSRQEAVNNLQSTWNDVMPAGITGWLPDVRAVSGRTHGLLPGSVRAQVYVEKVYLTE